MITPFSSYQKIEDIIPLLNDDKFVVALCDNIVFVMEKMLDPYGDECAVFSRNDATIVGLFAKIARMAKESLESYKQGKADVASLFYRIEYEAYLKIRYLIEHGEQSQYEYRLASYKARYLSYKYNKENPNPIGNVMTDKFLADISEEGFSIEDLENNQKLKSFGGKNIRDLMSEYGEGNLYSSVYGITSDMIHSDWGDTRQNYLFGENNQLAFRYEPRTVHYRMIVSYARLNVQAADHYASWAQTIGYSEIALIADIMTDFKRILQLIEQYLFKVYSESPNTFMKY